MGKRRSLYHRLGSVEQRQGNHRPFEVFVQNGPKDAFTHVGSVRATDGEFALQWAKEVYTRRLNPVALWVVDRESIWEASGAGARELFERSEKKGYRLPGFVASRHRALSREILVDGAVIEDHDDDA
jgi:ring-1,2-phenylacetyl-CoA epoxidase subunit PaaB